MDKRKPGPTEKVEEIEIDKQEGKTDEEAGEVKDAPPPKEPEDGKENSQNEEESESISKELLLENDGHFMERFLKMQEDMKQKELKKKELFGTKKRAAEPSKGPTKKNKSEAQDPLMNEYLAEVRKFQSRDCTDEGTGVRPLVK
eukprot:CAMPEP_0177663570 /NCGR_PEP_ID=MMETSP0447-20121125/19992_1 /TAXON_ID=0 /ORGANISM="Stygamoeba regulata, Strain BSH-02190019" /LENGTH=143 /DNA_ID=CAMNT_0019169407 /DNA_START=20 /DNA_END=451 /DNA_ORIENTATION=+